MRQLLVLVMLAACGEDFDEGIPDYQNLNDGWEVTEDISGNAPGHENSIRRIWTNREAREWGTLGPPDGAIVVKEVFDDNNGAVGDLRYLAIMRRRGEIHTGLENEGGWIFTETDGPTGPEKKYGFCWQRCHVAAPYNGLFYDYRR